MKTQTQTQAQQIIRDLATALETLTNARDTYRYKHPEALGKPALSLDPVKVPVSDSERLELFYNHEFLRGMQRDLITSAAESLSELQSQGYSEQEVNDIVILQAACLSTLTQTFLQSAEIITHL